MSTQQPQQQPRSFRGRGGVDSHKHAMEYFAKKLQDNSQSVRANQGMAALLLREHKVDEAMDHYATAALAAPNDIIVRNDYAIALSKTGAKRDGVEVMRSALQLDTDNPGLRNNMSALLSRKGQAPDAMGMQYTVSRHRSMCILFCILYMCSLLTSLGCCTFFRPRCCPALSDVFPHHPWSHLATILSTILSTILCTIHHPYTTLAGEYSEALTHAVRAVQLRPELPIHHKNVAQIYSIR